MKYLSIIKIGITAILQITFLFLMGCSSSTYLCPLKDLPGACSSQLKAYQATLTREATQDSIFENDENKR